MFCIFSSSQNVCFWMNTRWRFKEHLISNFHFLFRFTVTDFSEGRKPSTKCRMNVNRKIVSGKQVICSQYMNLKKCNRKPTQQVTLFRLVAPPYINFQKLFSPEKPRRTHPASSAIFECHPFDVSLIRCFIDSMF